MQGPGKIENVKKVYARAWDRQLCLIQWRGEVCGSREKFIAREGRVAREMTLQGLSKLRQVAPGSATQGL